MTTQTDERQPISSFTMGPGEDEQLPGYLKEGDHGVDGGGNYTVEQLAFKGYVKVWDNRTGVMSYQPRWLLWQTALLKRPDGSRIFTDKDPHIPQNYGLDLVCLLHPDSPEFPELKSMGFKPCMKHHTPTKAALDEHMRKSHKRAYVAMQDVLASRRREEDRELQLEVVRSNQQLVKAMLGSQVKATRGRRKKAT